MVVQRIFLTGFMGAGKTTIGKKLARQLGYEFVDLDHEIEKVENMKIEQIFERGGEVLFRDIEDRELTKILACTRMVIATGGGTFVQERNHARMLAGGLVVFIDVPLALCRARVKNDRNRPLLREKEPGELAKRFADRYPIYSEAPVRVNGRKSIPAIVSDIVRYLGTQ